MNQYQQYVQQYQSLLNSDHRIIEHYLNHTAYDQYGDAASEYYERMMIEHYDHTPEDFM